MAFPSSQVSSPEVTPLVTGSPSTLRRLPPDLPRLVLPSSYFSTLTPNFENSSAPDPDPMDVDPPPATSDLPWGLSVFIHNLPEIHQAVIAVNYDAVCELVTTRFLNEGDVWGYTALDYARGLGHTLITELLRAYGAGHSQNYLNYLNYTNSIDRNNSASTFSAPPVSPLGVGPNWG